MVVFVAQQPQDAVGPSRVGFAVSKGVGNAVTRNRVKRRLRAIAAPLLPATGVDVVVRANPAAALADFNELAGSMRRQFDRAMMGPSARGGSVRGGS